MGKIFDEVRAEFDEKYRQELMDRGYIQVPISLRFLFNTDWIHKAELQRIRDDFKDFFDIREAA